MGGEPLRLKYFAWVREQLGVGGEEVRPPESVKTIADLIAWLCERDERYRTVLCDSPDVRFAVDQEMAEDREHSVEGAREVAFFPPMTGG